MPGRLFWKLSSFAGWSGTGGFPRAKDTFGHIDAQSGKARNARLTTFAVLPLAGLLSFFPRFDDCAFPAD